MTDLQAVVLAFGVAVSVLAFVLTQCWERDDDAPPRVPVSTLRPDGTVRLPRIPPSDDSHR